MWKVVRIPAGDITNLHYNFVVAKPLILHIAAVFQILQEDIDIKDVKRKGRRSEVTQIRHFYFFTYFATTKL